MKQKISKVSKTIISLVIALSLTLVSLIGLTVAYFTDSKSYSGNINFGFIELNVTGDSIDSSGLTFTNSRTSSDATGTVNAMPGDEVTLSFTIKLKEKSEPAYYLVRIADNLSFFTTTGMYYYDSTAKEIKTSNSSNMKVGKIEDGDSHSFTYKKTIATTDETNTGETDTIKVDVYAIQQANIDECNADNQDKSAYHILTKKLTPVVTGVNLPTVSEIKTAITNWTSLESLGFYYTSGVPTDYSLDSDLTNALNVANLNIYKKSDTEIAFVCDGVIYAPEDCSKMYLNCYSLTNLGLSNFDTSKVINMSFMFKNCGELTDLDVSNFNTSKVTDMSDMFNSCLKLTSLDVSSFDTSSVTNMNSMFGYCYGLTSLKVDNFDTSKVNDMGFMFCSCSALTRLSLSSFDTSNVENWDQMFDGAFYGASTSVLTIGDKFVIDGSNTFTKTTLNSKTKFNKTVTLMRGTTEVTA